jgi:ribonuclease D
LGSPNQNSKTVLNSIHKPYTIKIPFLCHGLPGKSGSNNIISNYLLSLKRNHKDRGLPVAVYYIKMSWSLIKRAFLLLRSQASMSYKYVDTDSGLKQLLADLAGASRIALDIEADSLHHYFEKVCLIQLTTSGSSYIVDPLAGAELGGLFDLLSGKELIFHGGDYDLRMLWSGFGFRPQNRIFDTMLAAQLLGFEQIGLIALVERYFGVVLSKRGQRWDWSRRPLKPKQLDYATNDTFYLEEIAQKLEEQLSQKGRLPWHRESCENLIRVTSTDKEPLDSKEKWRIKGCGKIERRELAFVKAVWHWRDAEAQRLDLPPFKIMGNQLILDLAKWAASSDPESFSTAPKLPRNFGKFRQATLLQAISQAKKLEEADLPKRRKISHVHQPPDLRERIDLLRDKCKKLAGELEISSGIMAPQAAIRAVVSANAKTVEQIAEAGPLMRWQAELLKTLIE